MKYKEGTLLRLKTHRSGGGLFLHEGFRSKYPKGSTGLVFYDEDRVVCGIGIQMLQPPAQVFWSENNLEDFWEIVKEPGDDS